MPAKPPATVSAKRRHSPKPATFVIDGALVSARIGDSRPHISYYDPTCVRLDSQLSFVKRIEVHRDLTSVGSLLLSEACKASVVGKEMIPNVH